VGLRQLRDAGPLDRPPPGKHLVEHEAEGVEIGPSRHPAALELLRRHVGRCSRGEVVSLEAPGGAGEAEIREAHAPAAVDHHVGRLQVAVKDALGMGGGEAGGELAGDGEAPVHGEPTDAAQKRSQVLAVQVLHRQEVLPADLADVVDAAHVGVAHLRATRTSPWNRANQSESRARAGGRNLSATVWPSLRSSAWNTSPMPPRPSGATIR
jgi:hypothetical protein